ncbi:MAG TPA: helix-turn-helix transcriptional regulator [Vicinamibacterales bacterium]|nr:helix-turn-helix transcriptional regulator [Vicinamibacterales bacterium]
MSATARMRTTEESFGSRLRRERERRQIPLASIAENTKISVSHFEDLERDNVARWPSGIFRKNFIRAYAKAIGLDVEETTREFLERFPDPNEPPPAEEAVAQIAASKTGTAPPAPAPKPAVRIVADPPPAFTAGSIAASIRSRLTAVACDAAVVGTIGLVVYAVLGALWAPLCIAIVGYYGGGILLLGNTPGVCFVAAAERTEQRTTEHRQLGPSKPEAV